MLKIKLSPRGQKHQITYRIVVAPARSKNNGKFIDDLGYYNPQTHQIKIDTDKVKTWISHGAKLALGVDKLLNPDKYPAKPKKVRTKKDKPVPPQSTNQPADNDTTANTN